MDRRVVVFGPERAAEVVQGHLQNLMALETLFTTTENPIFVWEALAVVNVLQHARARGLPVPPMPSIPEWALDYLLHSAGEIAKLASESAAGSNPIAHVPHALGFTDGTKTNRFVEYRRLRRSVDLDEVKRQRQAMGARSLATTDDVKSTFRGPRDKTTVSRARKRGKAIRDLINDRLK